MALSAKYDKEDQLVVIEEPAVAWAIRALAGRHGASQAAVLRDCIRAGLPSVIDNDGAPGSRAIPPEAHRLAGWPEGERAQKADVEQ